MRALGLTKSAGPAPTNVPSGIFARLGTRATTNPNVAENLGAADAQGCGSKIEYNENQIYSCNQ